ncbi:hypothetical protein STEG23_022619 [Scotinomys teguina]
MEAVANQRQREQTVTTVQDKVQDAGNIRDAKLPLDILLCEYESCTTTNTKQKAERESIQINKIRNEFGDITTDNEEIQRIIRSYFKTLNSTKLENLEGMDKFLDRYHIPKLDQDQIDNINRPISPEEIETVIKSLPNTKGPRADDFSVEFYQIFKEELIPTLFKLFHTIETEGTLPNFFYEAKGDFTADGLDQLTLCSQSPGFGTPAAPVQSSSSHSLGPRSTKTPLDQKDPGHHWTRKTQEHLDTIGLEGHRCNQTIWTKRTQKDPETFRPRGTRSTQTALDKEDSRAPRHHWTKRPTLSPLSEAEIGRRQCKSTYTIIKNKTTPESSSPTNTKT